MGKNPGSKLSLCFTADDWSVHLLKYHTAKALATHQVHVYGPHSRCSREPITSVTKLNNGTHSSLGKRREILVLFPQRKDQGPGSRLTTKVS